MSRNFELLQRIGREQALYTTPEEVEVEQSVEQPVVFSPPVASTLGMTGSELEEFTKLVQRLFVVPGNDSPRSVVFCAPERGNGSSWVTARVADVLASQVSGSVCMVDANLRRPGLHAQFSVENHYGLSDALLKPDPIRQFAQGVGRPNLWLISSGSNPEGAQNLLSTDRMRLRLSELRAEFDYVLLDVAALNDGNDAMLLGGGGDGVVLILKANASRRESARKAVQDLQAAKARVLGAVLNQRTFPIPDSIYNKL
ncbi:MAG TPA: CpsD/CapB family tyrosine-protein kinase [Candidatus Binatia bacterium]|nr:CpsD/CapB family tyrosine-protein kinase [Candidatus Binatia bacterium]